jgi:hypothetical protein
MIRIDNNTVSLHWEIDVVHKAAATRQELSILHARQGLAEFYVTHGSDGVVGFRRGI